MTRSENMEHVEVLRHMKETIKAIMPSEVAALDAAIASLSAPQPPAEAQAVGGGEEGFKAWVVEQMPAGTVIDNPALWADRLARAYELNVPAPPSAPVGVEGDGDGELSPEDLAFGRGYSAGRRDAKSDALAQQPAAVDGAMVERAARAWCAGTDTPFDQLPDTGKARCLEDMRVVLTAALAAQQGGAK